MRVTATDGELQPIVAAASLELEDAEDSEVHAAPTLRRRLSWVPPLALLYALDKLLALLSPAIHFPASLIGMAAIVALLLAAEHHRPALAVAVELWFRPGVVRAAPVCITRLSWVLGCRLSTPGVRCAAPSPQDFVHCWLPLWYIPAIVCIPLAVQPLSGGWLNCDYCQAAAAVFLPWGACCGGAGCCPAVLQALTATLLTTPNLQPRLQAPPWPRQLPWYC